MTMRNTINKPILILNLSPFIGFMSLLYLYNNEPTMRVLINGVLHDFGYNIKGISSLPTVLLIVTMVVRNVVILYKKARGFSIGKQLSTISFILAIVSIFVLLLYVAIYSIYHQLTLRFCLT